MVIIFCCFLHLSNILLEALYIIDARFLNKVIVEIFMTVFVVLSIFINFNFIFYNK